MNERIRKMDSPMKKQCMICLLAAMMVLCNAQLCRADDAVAQSAAPQGEPVLCILCIPEIKSEKSCNAKADEDIQIYRLFELHPSDKHLKIFTGYSFLENGDFKLCNIGVYLYKREVDPNNNGRLLLKFEVECNGKLHPIPEISWNQKDDVLLWSGGNGIVFISTDTKHHYAISKNTK